MMKKCYDEKCYCSNFYILKVFFLVMGYEGGLEQKLSFFVNVNLLQVKKLGVFLVWGGVRLSSLQKIYFAFEIFSLGRGTRLIKK